MNSPTLNLQQLCDIAIQAAMRAGQYIQSIDHKDLQREFKEAGSSAASQVVTEVDRRSEQIIREQLAMTLEKYDIAFVGEESSLSTADSTEARFQKPYYWCVDPLDGTLPFVEGRAGYAVSIALVEQSGTPLIGVVYDPVSGTLIHAIKGQGAYLNNAPFVRTESAAESLKVYADRSFKSSAAFDRTVESLNACAQHLGLEGIELVYGNGAVKNACLVLQSAAACYLKSPKLEEGGGSIWDFAATACITKEAGGWASDSFGAALDLNHRDSTFMNHGGVLYASNETIARYLLENIALRP